MPLSSCMPCPTRLVLSVASQHSPLLARVGLSTLHVSHPSRYAPCSRSPALVRLCASPFRNPSLVHTPRQWQAAGRLYLTGAQGTDAVRTLAKARLLGGLDCVFHYWYSRALLQGMQEPQHEQA